VANDLFTELKRKNTYCFEQGKTQNRVQGYKIQTIISNLKKHLLRITDKVSAAGIISNVTDLNIWDN
jgi:hypothetical protein